MIAGIVASARSSRRAALLLGGIVLVAGTVIADPQVAGPRLNPGRPLDARPGTAGAASAGGTTHRVAYPHASGFADLAHEVKGALFSIIAGTTESDPLSRVHSADQRSRLVTSQGSGFFITPDGYAVTSNHVIKGSVSIE
ncbi:MAG: S1C family serine protease, partial [Alphaproteobacteria bacterium]|nr:S1C family serine protease [Alphaproteobacteria bacterium]